MRIVNASSHAGNSFAGAEPALVPWHHESNRLVDGPPPRDASWFQGAACTTRGPSCLPGSMNRCTTRRPLTFDHVQTSDHRFYDRQLITGFRPDGEAGFLAGITVFKNMNVIEGYVIAQSHSRRQINVRFTRPLRPIEVGMNVGIGPLRLEILEPLERTRLVLESGEFPLALDLTFEGTIPAHLENPHFGRMDGRAHSDYLRYHQIGRVSGLDHDRRRTLRCGGLVLLAGSQLGRASRRRRLRALYGNEDGRGRGLGIAHRRKGTLPHLRRVLEPPSGRRCADHRGRRGKADLPRRRSPQIGGEAIPVAAARHEIVFLPGTRVFETANLTLGLANGETWQLKARAVGRPWAFCGGGTDGGFFDGQGQGVWRGADLVTEVDVYDVTHPERVIARTAA